MLSLRLALALWVALVPIVSAAAAGDGLRKMLVLEVVTCSVAESTPSACAPRADCAPSNRCLSDAAPTAAPAPMACVQCICLGDLSMEPALASVFLTPSPASETLAMADENTTSRFPRPPTPPPQSLVLL